jgi:predicted AAA+ superfamily ATPase
MAGQIFETAVVSEVVKSLWHSHTEPRVHFWRTATGQEVDLLIETAQGLVPVEIKASATLRQEMRGGIDHLRRDLGHTVRHGYVVFAGSDAVPLGPHVSALAFSQL